MGSGRKRRVLTVAHSYVVALNRRLVAELSRVGAGEWEFEAIAPSFFHGDLRSLELEREKCPPDAGYKLHEIPVYWSSRPHLFFYHRPYRDFAPRAFDLVHVWEEPYVFSGWQLTTSAPRGAAIVLASFQNLRKSYLPPFSWMERAAVGRAEGIIALGQTVAATLREQPLYRNKHLCFIPIGVDTDTFRPNPAAREAMRSNLGWGLNGPPVIGFLGRFVEEKGVKFLLTVLDSLSMPWRVLLVGSGPLEQELQRWASIRGDRARVVTGVPHDQVPRYLNAMDVLCAPSITTPRWREQFGRMLIEALSSGVPVIGSDSGEIPYTLGDAAEVVHEGDRDAWVTRLGALLDSPQHRQQLASAGRIRAHERFAWPVVARAHLEFFINCIDRKRDR